MSQSKATNLSAGNPRKKSSLNHGLDSKLLAYATAAGAGLLALAQPAHAEIVYTPANQTITPNQYLQLDLNNDGIADFTIQDQFFPVGRHAGGNFPTNGSYSVGNLVAFADGANAILVQETRFASDLSPNKRVGKAASWNFKDGFMDSCDRKSGGGSQNTGLWLNVKNRYLGLRFSIQG